MYYIYTGADTIRNCVVLHGHHTRPPIFGSQVRTPLGTFLRRLQTITSTPNPLYNFNLEARGGVLGSIYTYCSNICHVLKSNKHATFGAHRRVTKNFPHPGSNPGYKNVSRLL